jgi:hypothetical protein
VLLSGVLPGDHGRPHSNYTLPIAVCPWCCSITAHVAHTKGTDTVLSCRVTPPHLQETCAPPSRSAPSSPALRPRLLCPPPPTTAASTNTAGCAAARRCRCRRLHPHPCLRLRRCGASASRRRLDISCSFGFRSVVWNRADAYCPDAEWEGQRVGCVYRNVIMDLPPKECTLLALNLYRNCWQL